MYGMDGVHGRVILQSGIQQQQQPLQQQITNQQPVLIAGPGGRLSPGIQSTTTTIVDPRSVSPVLQLHPLGNSAQYYPTTVRAVSPVMPTTVLYTPSPSHVSLQPMFPSGQGVLQSTKGVQMHQLHPPPTSSAIIQQQHHPNNPNVVVAGQQHPSTTSINSVNIGPGGPGPSSYSTFAYAASSPSGSTQHHQQSQQQPLQQQYLLNQQGLQGQQQYLQQNPNALITPQQLETTQLIVIDPMSLPSMFQDRMIKMDYIRKVLGVLFTQVGLCFLIVNIFNIRGLKEWSQENSWFLWVSLGISVITIAVLVMTAESHQDCPMNYFLTWTFTLWTSFTFGSIASNPYFETSLQLIYYFDVTLIIVFALILSLILYALSPRDFNNQSCILYVVGIVVIFECIYFIFLPAFSEYLVPFLPSVVFAGVGGLFFSIYVIVDLNFMIHRCFYNSLTPESVMLGVIYLHTDIVNANGNFWGRC